MISLTSEMTDSKGRHARGWLFFDAECEFCTRTAAWLFGPMKRRGLAVQPLQDPRVAALLGLSHSELKRAIRFVLAGGRQYVGAEAVLAVAREFWWARPLVLISRFPIARRAIQTAYAWVARQRRCPAQHDISKLPC